MSVRKLRYYGDPILRQKAKKMHRFDASLPKLVQDMFETMRISAQGLFAWALQHEIDHLDGILYLDHLDRPEDLRTTHEDDDVEAEASVEKGNAPQVTVP
jgi:peptide deformylase